MPIKVRHNGKEDEQENKAEVFTYDPVGNRLTGPKEKLAYTYNTGNQLTELTKILLNKGGEGVIEDEQEKKVDYTYDKNGNLTKKVELNDDGQIKKTTFYSYNYEKQANKGRNTKETTSPFSPPYEGGEWGWFKSSNLHLRPLWKTNFKISPQRGN